MNFLKKILLMAMVAAAFGCRSEQKSDDRPLVGVEVDWEQFLARNDPTWERISENWADGAFIGNGLLGVMIYKDDENSLRFRFGRTDVTSRRRLSGVDWSIPRIPIGDAIMRTTGKVISERMHLDLYNAEVTGRIETDLGAISFRSFVAADSPLIIIETVAEGDESPEIFYRAQHGISPRIQFEGFKPNPADLPPLPTTTEVAGVEVTLSKLFETGDFAVARTTFLPAQNRTLAFFTIASSYPENGADKIAAETIAKLASDDLDRITTDHRDWWHNYYRQSFVSLPDPLWESFYWIQMYKHASATRADGIVIDNQGPWLAETGWPGTWWNLNVQLSYSPVYTANRLDRGQSLCSTLYRYRENLEANVPSSVPENGETTYHLERYSTYDLTGGLILPIPHELGNLAWALHNCWRHYRYSGDEVFLRDQLYPLLRGAINMYLRLVYEGEDGRLHLPATHSPEYNDPAVYPDTNYALAFFVWGLQTLLKITTDLGVDDSQADDWRYTLENLTEFPTDENGLSIARDQPLEFGHRHYSHLAAIFPLYLINPDNPDDLDLLTRSFEHWLNLGYGTGSFNGYSLAAASSIFSALGRGDRALEMIESFIPMLSPSTMYSEAGPVIETPFSIAESINNMLLQSWGGVIRVFAGVPPDWSDISFHDLRAEGAFLVSAVRQAGVTKFIRIKSLAGGKTMIKTDLIAPIISSRPKSLSEVDPSEGSYSLVLRKGEELLLRSAADDRDAADLRPVIEPVEIEQARSNPWGLK